MAPKAALAALALAVALAVAPVSPAQAAPRAEWVRGHTHLGNPIEFLLHNGNRISRLRTSVPARCVWAGPLSSSGVETFEPPGSFRVGTTRRVQALQNSAFTSAQVTKNYRVKLRRARGGRIRGRLHVSFSVLRTTYSSAHGWYLVPAACQGSDSVTVVGVD